MRREHKRTREEQEEEQEEEQRSIVELSKAGDAVSVSSLLSSNPKRATEADDRGRTALHWAAIRGHANVVDALADALDQIKTKRPRDRDNKSSSSSSSSSSADA